MAVAPVAGNVFFLAAQNAGVVLRVDGGVLAQQVAVPAVSLLEVARR